MIANFDSLKKQLQELAELVNSFKSEAVQLRIVDLVLGGAAVPPHQPVPHAGGGQPSRPRRARKSGAGAADAAPGPVRQRATSRRPGPVKTLNTILGEGYFKTGKTIGDIVKYCETKLALPFKQNELSGTLTRLVRDKKLTREKNSDGQYEYKQA